jgi:hypothetical protein
VEALCDALCTGATLKHLDLAQNFAGEAGGMAIVQLLERNRSLLQLIVPNNEMPQSVTSLFAGAIERAVNKRLRYLVVGGQSVAYRPYCNVLDPADRAAIRALVVAHRAEWEGHRRTREQQQAPVSAA